MPRPLSVILLLTSLFLTITQSHSEDKDFQKLHQSMDGSQTTNGFNQGEPDSNSKNTPVDIGDNDSLPDKFSNSSIPLAPTSKSKERRSLMASPSVERTSSESPSSNIGNNIKNMDLADAGVIATGSAYGVKFIGGGIAGVAAGVLIGIGAAALMYLSFVKPIFNPIGKLRQFFASRNKTKIDKETKTTKAPTKSPEEQTS